jgi:hypothetical protein
MKQEDKKFVIQQHAQGPYIHWDLMLETDGILQTYRLDKSPQQLADDPAAGAVKISNHPLKFLTYEGLVNKGLGEVSISDSGEYEIIRQSNDQIELDLTGKILKGKFTLTHLDSDNWQFAKSDI